MFIHKAAGTIIDCSTCIGDNEQSRAGLWIDMKGLLKRNLSTVQFVLPLGWSPDDASLLLLPVGRKLVMKWVFPHTKSLNT